MRSTVLILALIGCGNPELESENTDLKAKVEDLEKSEAKLKKKVESLKTKLATTERALTALQQAETYGKLGIEAGDALAVRFHTSLGMGSSHIQRVGRPRSQCGVRSWA